MSVMMYWKLSTSIEQKVGNDMVHVKKCPCEYGRGKPSTEFYIDGKPQIYCYGWTLGDITDAPECCKNCLDWVYGEQPTIDFEKVRTRSDN